jgi:hypothetical protein
MTHWADAYLGRPWIAGEAECWDFARTIWRERFGWPVPEAPVAGHDARLARRLFAEGADSALWAPVPRAAEGDAVLMARGRRVCHVGVWVAPGAILHAVEGMGGLCTPAGRIVDLGYRIAGTYRWVGC